MATATTSKTLQELTEYVRTVSESILNLRDDASGAALPEAGELPCTKCEGKGGETRPSNYHPSGEYFSRCYVCHGRGWHEPPQLDLILAGIYTERPHLRMRAGYGLSPRDLVKRGANATTVDLYQYIRANLRFDLGRNYNLGGLIMNNINKSHPFLMWAEAVNLALLIAHGRRESAGARRWAEVLGRVPSQEEVSA